MSELDADFGTATADESVELAVITRDGFIESRHIGSAVVLDPDGAVVARYGNPDALIYPRSALKPFIAIAVMTSGVPLRGEDAAIATSSHSGTPMHVNRVRSLLQHHGLTEAALKCTPDLPSDVDARNELLRSGGHAAPIYMGCSGKHAGMLAACVANDWSQSDYLSPDHPLQDRVRDVIERLTGEKPVAATADGCGTPLYAMSLTAMAKGMIRVGQVRTSPFKLYQEAQALGEAMRENGDLIRGPGEPESIAISRLNVVSKLGFEGIQSMVTPSGYSVALKTLDGSLRPGVPVAIELLARHGDLSRSEADATLEEIGPAMYGGSRRVGQLHVTVA